MSTHGDRSTCARCYGTIEYVQYTQATGSGTFEVLDAWWAHHNHPGDEHTATPVAEEQQFRAALTVLATCPPPRRRWWRR